MDGDMAAGQDAGLEGEEGLTAGLQALSISTPATGRTPVHLKSFVKGGRVMVLEGFTSPYDKLKLRHYDGPRNPYHDDKILVSPCLTAEALYSTGEGGADFDTFLETLQRQGKCVRDEHDESMHGHLRAIARYGNVYMYNTSHLSTIMTVEEFDCDMKEGQRIAEDRGQGMRRNDPYISHSFIPSAATRDVLQTFKETFNFEEFTRTEKYNVTCRFEPGGVENTIILDKDLKFCEFRPPGVKWMVLDLKRRPKSDAYPFGTDIRFKLQSRRILKGDELEKSEEYRKLLDPNHKVLEQGHSYGEPDLRIHHDYRGKVDFARRKLIRRFRAADDVQHSRFRTDVEVHLTEVCEYSRRRQDPSGHFSSVIPGRQEVTVIPPLPDWTSPEEVETFAREYWQFCLELGDTLYP
ncbi:uncharacterized protein LOC144911796 isoform X2 [Branchiostoma floridae x Branchiostoma belcheri]